MGINKVILLGNLGKDPELRRTANQTAVCTFSLATGERRRDAQGNWVDHTEWHNVVVFGSVAENCAKYLQKGRQCFIEGRIQTRKWQDRDGKDRYTTEIIATNVQFVGGGKATDYERVSSNDSHDHPGAPSPFSGLQTADTLPQQTEREISFEDDDIPF
jgi:single-strand DNA-binding protein